MSYLSSVLGALPESTEVSFWRVDVSWRLSIRCGGASGASGTASSAFVEVSKDKAALPRGVPSSRAYLSKPSYLRNSASPISPSSSP